MVRLLASYTLVLLSSGAALSAGCALEKPASPSAAAGRPAQEVPVVGFLTPGDIQRCLGFPTALVTVRNPESGPDGGPGGVEVSLHLAPATTPSVEIVDVLLVRGRSHFGAELPSLLGGCKSGPECDRARAFEGPHLVDGAMGRKISVQERDFFLGGGLVWGTLASPRGGYDLTLALQQVPHDTGIALDDLKALRAIDLAKSIVCLDAGLW